MAENHDNKDFEYMTNKRTEYSDDIDKIFNNSDEDDIKLIISSQEQDFQELADNTFEDDDFSEEDLDFVDSIQDEINQNSETSQNDDFLEVADTSFVSESSFDNISLDIDVPEHISSSIEDVPENTNYFNTQNSQIDSEEAALPDELEFVSEKSDSDENIEIIPSDDENEQTLEVVSDETDKPESVEISDSQIDDLFTISEEENVQPEILETEDTPNLDVPFEEPITVKSDDVDDSYNNEPSIVISEEETPDEIVIDNNIQENTIVDSVSEIQAEESPQPESDELAHETNAIEPHGDEFDGEDAIIIKKDAPIENIEIIAPDESAQQENEQEIIQDVEAEQVASDYEIPDESAETSEDFEQNTNLDEPQIIQDTENEQMLEPFNDQESLSESDITSHEVENDVVNKALDELNNDSSDFEIIEEDEEENQKIIIDNSENNISEEKENADEEENKVASDNLSLENIENFTLPAEPELVISENSDDNSIEELVEPKTPEEEYLEENVYAVCSIDDKRGFYFAKNEQTYALFGYLNDEIILLKDFQELYDKSMGMRLEERKFYSESYLVKVNSFKFLVEVDETSMKIVMEL